MCQGAPAFLAHYDYLIIILIMIPILDESAHCPGKKRALFPGLVSISATAFSTLAAKLKIMGSWNLGEPQLRFTISASNGFFSLSV